MRTRQHNGFTLVELSIVLVIIGLLIGGVLVGRDMIDSARIRSQISQIEQYKTAVNTFKNKYNGLPGDLRMAQNFGFSPRTIGYGLGQGDGDGVIQGTEAGHAASNQGCRVMSGETAVFFRDLSEATLVNGTFSTATVSVPGADATTSSIAARFPQASIGQANYVYPWSGGANSCTCCVGQAYGDRLNYLAVAQAYSNDTDGRINARTGLTVSQAYQIDSKIDDGLPQSGKTKAWYIHQWSPGTVWAAGNGSYGTAPGVAAAASSSSCYDNGNNAASLMQYSNSTNDGRGVNCALSFQF
jgi:prepilin-type N-terminal cleavage/methylation domain-containing protein